MSSPSNGNSFSVNTDSIPEELKRHRNWVLWKFELKIGTDSNPEKNPDGTDKYTKVPYTVNGHKASSINSDKWDTFENVLSAFQNGKNKFSGVGFVFSEDTGIIGIDFDHVTHEYTSQVDGIVYPRDWVPGVYDEIKALNFYTKCSPSGKGCHVLVKGELFFFLGDGDNGKSVILSLLSAMLGDENISSLTLSNLANPNFDFFICELKYNLETPGSITEGFKISFNFEVLRVSTFKKGLLAKKLIITIRIQKPKSMLEFFRKTTNPQTNTKLQKTSVLSRWPA